MVTYLMYYHVNDVMFNYKWRFWVLSWFDDPSYHGTTSDNYFPVISVTNWDNVKAKLPFWRLPKFVMDSYEYSLYCKIQRITQGNPKNSLT